ncbi:MAG: polysaccharide biosynthesis/export family protein [Neomegalonema sp.]|nr:polysaccharide biosynthesis/export family protein [Neomegalonema sp.]
MRSDQDDAMAISPNRALIRRREIAIWECAALKGKVMFGKVNVLLLSVFCAILGVQLFWNPGVPETDLDKGPTSARSTFERAESYSPIAPAPEEAITPSAVVATPAPARAPVAAPAKAETVATPVKTAEAPKPADKAPLAIEAAKRSLPIRTSISTKRSRRGRSGLLVTYAETLSIRFHGYKEITGLYRVNDDETVSIPVIDRVSVAGLTSSDLETVLAQKVFDLTGRRSDVTIEVEKYQPIFVSGIVSNAGSFEWRRNMTVMHAVALAGGFYRSADRTKSSVDLIDAKLSIERTRSELKRAITRSARLVAERDGVAMIKTPARLTALVGDLEARTLIESEQALLVAARSASALQLSVIDASLRAAEDEVSRLKEYTKTLHSKLDERKEYIARLGKLKKRGFVSEERMTDLRSSAIDIETQIATTRVSVSRAEASRLALKRDRIKLVQTRAAKLTEELVKLEADIEEKQLAYAAAKARRSEMASAPDAAVAAAEKKAGSIVYRVVRRSPTGIQTLTATPFDKLLPGDVVIVDANAASVLPRKQASAGWKAASAAE